MQAPLGRATTRSLERVAASVGMLHGAAIEFELVKDVPDGGVLFALPALLLLGLLSKSRQMFSMSEGFYPLESIFLLLALIALARIPSLEALRYVAPGEWGKLMGLDRIPEVRTLRQKITELCSEQGSAERWSNALARQWMAEEPECAGVFYADGHVRVYHGKLTDLPRRYIARERLCLRGTTDYWVNAMDGRPFFVVSCAVDPGLLSVLREHIAPRLKAEVPNQPTEGQLEADPLLSRFTIVFDREGYSPQFFAQMKEQRIAILTYHKFPGEPWSEQEFRTHQVSLVNGEQVRMKLAERGVQLSNDLWVREVRHLSEKGHQSSILSTDYRSDLSRVAVAMFARWSQEIFFKYMRQHYNLDRLVEYGTEVIPDTTRVVNPAWRQLDSQIRRQNGLLSRELVQFAEIQLPQEIEPQQVEGYQQKKGQLQQAIEERRHQIEQLKAQRKALPKHIEIKDLPEQDRFHRLLSEKKHFIDTIKLIAYRAETALAQLAREKIKRLDDARSLIRQLFRTEVDLVPDQQNKTLTVRLHPMSTEAHDEIVRHIALVLCVDEKPCIQALERAQGWIRLPNGRALTGFAHEYKRHGTTTLFAALEVATGLVHAGHYRRRRRREFLDFMNELVAKNPDTEIHVVLDNLNTHKPKQDRWLKAHPQVHFHFIPTRSSWLNQVECWFSILSRGALQGASFTSVKMLIEAIETFIASWNQHATPFEWTKEEVHQQQIKHSYSNLCN